MLDFIIALIMLTGLVWFFSSQPIEDEPKTETVMYMPSNKGEAVPVMDAVSPSGGKPPLAPKPIDKRPETSEPVGDNSAPTPTKTIEELAWEVIIGYWGYMEDRWQRLSDAGYDAAAVQARVNELMKQFT